MIISGCTICEKPYIKQNGNCCLDNNSNTICDTEDTELTINEKTVEKIEIKDDKTDDNDILIFDYEIDKISLVSDYHEPIKSEDAIFIISTTKINKVTGITFEFKPLCNKLNQLNIFLNDKYIDTLDVICHETNSLKIDNKNILEGLNQFQFSTPNNDYLIEDGTVLIHYIDIETDEQQMNRFAVESKEKNSKLNSKNNVAIRNYNEMKFNLDENQFTGDLNLEFNINEKGNLYIYLNNFEIYHGQTTGNLELKLPHDKLKIGSNTIRYLINP